MIQAFVRKLALLTFALTALNFVLLAIIGQYNFRLGPIHLEAVYLFKPLLYINASFLIALVLQYRPSPIPQCPEPSGAFRPTRFFWAASVALVAVIYAISFAINLDFPDWTHRLITTRASPWSFFFHRQYDGFYRPLTFLSLWVDNRVFAGALWGYHIQNLLFHLLNGLLVARLAFRMGFNQRLAAWAGLAFLAIPASFEAVIWPGARFDLMSATFVFLALERALAGSVRLSVAAFCCGVLCKETAYAYPLLLIGLFLLRRPAGLRLPPNKWTAVLASAFAAAVFMLLIRISVYGNLGGYPQTGPAGGTVNFVFTPKTFTDIPARLPAALFLFNTGAGLPFWLRLDLIAYAVFLSIVLFYRAQPGPRTLLLVLSVIAVLPMLNMFGWMTQFAQQGRYLYQPVIWILFVVLAAIASLRLNSVLLPAWVVIMAAAALFNTLAYVRMLNQVHVAASQAVAACKTAGCCRTLSLTNLPRDLYGAFYFGNQVTHDVQQALPNTAVIRTEPASPSACSVNLRWTSQNTWSH